MQLQRLPLFGLAGLAGLVLWGGWLFGFFGGGAGAVDARGQVLGTDFAMFYAAGRSFAAGWSDKLYDFAFQKQLQQQLVGAAFTGSYNFYLFPLSAMLYAPFSALRYSAAFAAWSLISLSLMWHALRFLNARLPLRDFLLALTFYPVFASVSFGQNSLLSLFVFSAVYSLLNAEKRFAAGLAGSAVAIYKPQLLLGLIAVWVIGIRRRELLGMTSGIACIAAAGLIIMPEALYAFIGLAASRFSGLTLEAGFPAAKQISVHGFWMLLTGSGGAVAGLASAVTAAGGLILAACCLRGGSGEPAREMSTAVLLTFWLSPHMMVYEAALLLLPAVLLEHQSSPLCAMRRSYAVVVWTACFVAVGCTQIQLNSFGAALQPATLAILGVSAHYWWKCKLEKHGLPDNG